MLRGANAHAWYFISRAVRLLEGTDKYAARVVRICYGGVFLRACLVIGRALANSTLRWVGFGGRDAPALSVPEVTGFIQTLLPPLGNPATDTYAASVAVYNSQMEAAAFGDMDVTRLQAARAAKRTPTEAATDCYNAPPGAPAAPHAPAYRVSDITSLLLRVKALRERMRAQENRGAAHEDQETTNLSNMLCSDPEGRAQGVEAIAVAFPFSSFDAPGASWSDVTLPLTINAMRACRDDIAVIRPKKARAATGAALRKAAKKKRVANAEADEPADE
jgi:hypothetical protein